MYIHAILSLKSLWVSNTMKSFRKNQHQHEYVSCCAVSSRWVFIEHLIRKCVWCMCESAFALCLCMMVFGEVLILFPFATQTKAKLKPQLPIWQVEPRANKHYLEWDWVSVAVGLRRRWCWYYWLLSSLKQCVQCACFCGDCICKVIYPKNVYAVYWVNPNWWQWQNCEFEQIWFKERKKGRKKKKWK